MGPAPAVQMDLGPDIPADGFEKQNKSGIVIDLPTNLVSALWQVARARGSLMCLGL